MRSSLELWFFDFRSLTSTSSFSMLKVGILPPGRRRKTAGSNAPGAFLVFFFCRGQLPQTSARSKQYLPVNFVRLAFIRQNFHESWCRKLPAI